MKKKWEKEWIRLRNNGKTEDRGRKIKKAIAYIETGFIPLKKQHNQTINTNSITGIFQTFLKLAFYGTQYKKCYQVCKNQNLLSCKPSCCSVYQSNVLEGQKALLKTSGIPKKQIAGGCQQPAVLRLWSPPLLPIPPSFHSGWLR